LAPYIEKEMRDVGEMQTNKLESLRNLIIDVGMFLDLVNVVKKTFEIHLLKKELSVHFIYP